MASTLHSAGVSSKGIMSVTGHRNVQSLASYVKPSESEKRKISTILSNNNESTGHPNVQSLASYVKQTDSEKGKISKILSNSKDTISERSHQPPTPSSAISPPTTGNTSTQLNRLDLDHTLSFLIGHISVSTININIYQKS